VAFEGQSLEKKAPFLLERCLERVRAQVVLRTEASGAVDGGHPEVSATGNNSRVRRLRSVFGGNSFVGRGFELVFHYWSSDAVLWQVQNGPFL
jgi:hypothetical protein